MQEFQYLLSRLASLLVCYSMCDISSLDRSRFPHLDTKFMDPSSLEYLEAQARGARTCRAGLDAAWAMGAHLGVVLIV